MKGAVSLVSSANPVSIVMSNPAPSAVGAVIGTQIFNSAASAAEVVNDTVRVGGYTAAIATSCQCVADTYRWVTGGINARELGRRTFRNTTVNSTAVVGGAGGSAVGGAIGTGDKFFFFFFFFFFCTQSKNKKITNIEKKKKKKMEISNIPRHRDSARLGDWRSVWQHWVGKLVNDKFDDWWYCNTIVSKNESDDSLNASLQYFGFAPKDFKNPDVVAIDNVTQRYKEYARIYHPDRGGTKEEWITLVNHFSIVSNAIRRRDKVSFLFVCLLDIMLPGGNREEQEQRTKRELQEVSAAHQRKKTELEQRIVQLQNQNEFLVEQTE
ncbi:hypothetical protein RFI_15267, partial [Reticulomyxa filosa]